MSLKGHLIRTKMKSLIWQLTCLALLNGCAQNNIIRIESVNQNSRVRYIVIHFTTENFSESLKTLTQASDRPVSSHYLIPSPNDATYPRKKLMPYQLVPETQRAWHAGKSYWQGEKSLNDSSVGIEIVNTSFCTAAIGVQSQDDDNLPDLQDCRFKAYPKVQIELVVKLLKGILARHTDIATVNIVGHSDIAPDRKVDPGPLFPWEKLHNVGIGPWPDPQTTLTYQKQFESIPPPLALLQKALKTYGYLIDVTGRNDSQSRLAVRAFQFHFRQHNPSGLFDAESAAILFALIERYRNELLRDLLLEYGWLPA